MDDCQASVWADFYRCAFAQAIHIIAAIRASLLLITNRMRRLVYTSTSFVLVVFLMICRHQVKSEK